MNRSRDDNENKKMVFQPEPLCLFHFPEEVSFLPPVTRTYVNTLPKTEPKIKLTRRKRLKDDGSGLNIVSWEQKLRDQIKAKGKEEVWLKKRSEARVMRRRMKEPVRHLKSYLLTSVNNEKAPKKGVVLPSLFEVLETVKDAWPPPPPPRRNIYFNRHEGLRSTLTRDKMLLTRGKMKEDMYLQFPSPLINRRFSMPEELMRKYFIMKEKTSEESETVKTMDEITSSSTTTTSTVEVTARRRPQKTTQPPVAEKLESSSNVTRVKSPETISTLNDRQQNAQQQLSTTLDQPRRVTQIEYYNQGKGVIKVKEASVKSSLIDACTCTNDKTSLTTTTTTTTTLSPKEETDESPTADSIVSSSPVLLPKQESPSDLLSSESDYIQCTCRELTSSKETSTDIFHSGKSTLSQTVSDKSVSTQDSTISVHSVSTRGSTVTDNSNTTTPDADKTSAKEQSTTTSDNTPRTPLNNLNRKSRRRDGYRYEEHGKSCPKYLEVKHSRNEEHTRQCPVHSKPLSEPTESRKSCAINTDITIDSDYIEPGFEEQEVEHFETFETFEPLIEHDGHEEDEETGEVYTWAKLSHDELYMMQQLRHQKLIESQLERVHNEDSETCDTMTLEYDETDNLEQSIMIPRYSALPRSLSMLVNMSSPENSVQNSDSDNLSLADSLEDQPTTHVHRLYFDTKKESKPVRGDVNIVDEKIPRIRVPKGKAFFVSIKDPFGEDALLEGIEKIPEPPEKIKKQINERHLNINRHSPEHCECKTTTKKRKARSVKKEEIEKEKKTQVKKEHADKGVKKKSSKEQKSAPKKYDAEEVGEAESTEGLQKKRGKAVDHSKGKNTAKKMEENKEKDKEKRFSSKIPVLMSSSSNSSPERGDDKSSQVVETTQILEITHTDKGVSLQEHQQPVKQPSSNPPAASNSLNRHSMIPPLVGHPPYRPAINRQVFQTRRSPVSKYRHRFEVIPEEKSSSLSSAEEKPTEKSESLPKFTTTGTSPLPVKEETVQFETYNLNDMPNLIMAQVEDKQLKTLPYLKGSEDQKIILFSSKPQNSNSSKGRDALIAMNREDFNRLAKGWMNFYKLRENAEATDQEVRINKENNNKEDTDKSRDSAKRVIKSGSETKQSNLADDRKNNNTNNLNKADNSQITTEKATTRARQLDVDENIRFHSSNTILRTVKTISPRNSTTTMTKRSSLPDLNLPTERKVECPKPKSSTNTLPSVIQRTECSEEESDSDSTDYLEPPSPRVPPLPLEDFPSDATLSSSESEIDDVRPHTTANAMKKYELKKWGGTNRGRLKKETARTKKNSGWSVTVAGTVELSRSAPDLEMRLSFPVNGGPPVVCQSDSGFAEDSNYSKLSEPAQESVMGSSRKELSLLSGNSKQKWTVTVQNPNQGNIQHNPKSKPSKNLNNHLFPDLEAQRNRNTKKVLKKSLKKVIARKLYAIWPRIQQVVQDEFYADDFRLMNECSEDVDDDCLLTVRGTAVPLEKKEKPLTMTERDVTRRYTSRERNSYRGSECSGAK